MIKSTVRPVVNDTMSFPKLMIDGKNTIILFDEMEKGVVVNVGNSQYTLGYAADMWRMNHFTDLPIAREVVLSNTTEKT